VAEGGHKERKRKRKGDEGVNGGMKGR